jgi:hypothetical protein
MIFYHRIQNSLLVGICLQYLYFGECQFYSDTFTVSAILMGRIFFTYVSDIPMKDTAGIVVEHSRSLKM